MSIQMGLHYLFCVGISILICTFVVESYAPVVHKCEACKRFGIFCEENKPLFATSRRQYDQTVESMDYIELLKNGFSLEWTGINCVECQLSIGRCWLRFPFNNETNPECGLRTVVNCTEETPQIQLERGGRHFEVKNIQGEYNYTSCQDYIIHYNHSNHIPPTPPPPPPGCSIIQYPVNISTVGIANLFPLLTSDITLEVHVFPHCWNCLRREGQCQDDEKGKFQCDAHVKDTEASPRIR
ncbi:hypothetical protein CK203_011768 [Vitis vinifera]|uniref:Wall-associated receptor kinase C-terminal domain-containing protein n=1 Tax=Vitis vinifera TaxID=29760 RepID=A0A438JUM0_VITVI|nr:hypothetical protein CK203_011768 [Vitis vinifera]